MRSQFFRIFALICLATGLAACGPEPQLRSGLANASGEKLGDVPDFAEVRERVLAPYCLRCHVNYGEYPAVASQAAAVWDAVRTGRMPKGGPLLPTDVRDVLDRWVRAGAPFTKGPTPAPTPRELAPDYESLAENVFGPRCVVCHSPRGEAKFLDLSSGAGLRAAAAKSWGGESLFVPEDPEASYLIQVIRDPVEPMPPRRPGLRPLNEGEIDVLVEWIRRGTPGLP